MKNCQSLGDSIDMNKLQILNLFWSKFRQNFKMLPIIGENLIDN